MRKFFDLVFWLLESMCKIMMLLQVLITAYVVMGRYVFNRTPAWGEQITLMLLTWLGMTSAAITMRENSHIKVTIIENILPAKAIAIIDHLVDIVLFAFFCGLFYSGWLLARQSMTTVLPALGIKKVWLYASVPVAGAFLALAVILKVLYPVEKKQALEGGDDVD